MSDNPDIYDMVISFEEMFESYGGEEAYKKSKRALYEKNFKYGMESHAEKSPLIRDNLESDHEEYNLSVWDSKDIENRLKFVVDEGRKDKGKNVELC